MTDPSYRHYVIIIDRSGSMYSIREDAEGGVARFIEDQKALGGKATLSLYEFDDRHTAVHSFTPLDRVRKYVLVPRGSTALLDACGFAITQEGEKLAAMPAGERPGKVIVLIATDGGENCSREYSKEQVAKLTTTQNKVYGWQFLYVGANQDAFAEAGGMGIGGQAAMSYAATPAGTRSAYDSSSAAATRYASGQSADTYFTDDERAAASGQEPSDG